MFVVLVLIGTYHWYQSRFMTTNKERIELLEEKLGGVQEGMQRMEVGITDKVQRLEETIAKLSEAFLSSRGSPSHNNYQQEGSH